MSTASVAAHPAVSRGRFPLLRRLFSFPVMLSSVLSMLAVLTVRAHFDDPDMWWHLKTGQIVWKTRTIPTTDIFSYTTHHHSLVPHEWLSQLLIYAAYRADGYTGLMLWLSFFTIAVLVAGYTLCSLYSGNSKVAFIGAIAIWLFVTSAVAIRPQMIGYLLLTLELLILHQGRIRGPRWFFFLPPLFAAWVNCHGSFFLGMFLGAVFLLCSFFNFQLGLLTSVPWARRTRKMLALSLLLSAAALFFNPVGAKQVFYPLNIMFHQPVNLGYVYEWQPLQMNKARGIALMSVLAAIVLLIVIRKLELFLHELVMLSLGTWLAISHMRMALVFGILAAPILSRLLAISWDRYDPAQDRPPVNAGFIAVAICVACWAFPNRDNLVNQINRNSPVKAVEFINSHPIPGNMLNDYSYGGYLMWAAPAYPVFVDGNADAFEWAGVLSDYVNWESLRSDPNTLLNKYKINFCLLPRTSPLARVYPFMSQWKQIYSDDQSVIFERNATLSPTI